MKDYFRYHRDSSSLKYVGAHAVKSFSIACGYCGKSVAPNMGYEIVDSVDGISWTLATIYECPFCKNPVIYFNESKETISGAKYGREIKNLPENIATLYDECRTCYANQCYTSSQMIARTLLMHIAVEQGAEEGLSFAKYVDYLDSNGYIPPNGKQWVDFIRTSGNVANHEIVIKEKEETEKVISFLSTLLLVIYELPNLL